MFDAEREWVKEGFEEGVSEGVRRATEVEVAARIGLVGEMAKVRRYHVLLLKAQQLENKEIGVMLGVNTGTVAKIVASARKRGEL